MPDPPHTASPWSESSNFVWDQPPIWRLLKEDSKREENERMARARLKNTKWRMEHGSSVISLRAVREMQYAAPPQIDLAPIYDFGQPQPPHHEPIAFDEFGPSGFHLENIPLAFNALDDPILDAPIYYSHDLPDQTLANHASENIREPGMVGHGINGAIPGRGHMHHHVMPDIANSAMRNHIANPAMRGHIANHAMSDHMPGPLPMQGPMQGPIDDPMRGAMHGAMQDPMQDPMQDTLNDVVPHHAFEDSLMSHHMSNAWPTDYRQAAGVAKQSRKRSRDLLQFDMHELLPLPTTQFVDMFPEQPHADLELWRATPFTGNGVPGTGADHRHDSLTDIEADLFTSPAPEPPLDIEPKLFTRASRPAKASPQRTPKQRTPNSAPAPDKPPRGKTQENLQCVNCKTVNTPLWRRDNSQNALCNACGLFFKLHGTNRPLKLKTDVIKRRNRQLDELPLRRRPRKAARSQYQDKPVKISPKPSESPKSSPRESTQPPTSLPS